MAAVATDYPSISKGNIVKLFGAKSIKKGANWELADDLGATEKAAKAWIKNTSGDYYTNNDKKKKYVNRTFRNKGKNKNGRFYGKTEKAAQNIFERFQSQLHKARIADLKEKIDKLSATANKATLKQLKEAYEETKNDLNDELERLYYEKQLEIVTPRRGGINLKGIVNTMKHKNVTLKNKTKTKKSSSIWHILNEKKPLSVVGAVTTTIVAASPSVATAGNSAPSSPVASPVASPVTSPLSNNSSVGSPRSVSSLALSSNSSPRPASPPLPPIRVPQSRASLNTRRRGVTTTTVAPPRVGAPSAAATALVRTMRARRASR